MNISTETAPTVNTIPPLCRGIAFGSLLVLPFWLGLGAIIFALNS